MDEDPRAEGWVRRVGAADAEWLTYAGNNLAGKCATFDRNGGFYESVSYAGYAIRTHLPFRLAWRDAFVEPLPEQDVLKKIADFFMHVSYFRSEGSPWSTDFGDSSLGSMAAAWRLSSGPSVIAARACSGTWTNVVADAVVTVMPARRA